MAGASGNDILILPRLVFVWFLALSALPTMKSYSRPGVEAAVRLVAIKDPAVWERVLRQYKPMLLEKKGKELVDMDGWCETLGTNLQSKSNPFISKEDLVKIIQWKFAKGKPRPYMKFIKDNSNDDVKKFSERAFANARQGQIDDAFDEISKLKGVGVAGASAVLSLYCPERISFMDDEVIEALYNGKRGYTRVIYTAMNNECNKLARDLGSRWTPRKVGAALWTAARICAYGGQDFTVDDSKRSVSEESKPQQVIAQRAKRRKI